MANQSDDEKKKAEEAAAKKAAAEAERKAKAEKRAFRTIHNVMLDGVVHPAGAEIEIARAEWEALAASGSVAGAWT